MCAQHSSKDKKPYNLFAIYLLMICLGVISGMSDLPLLQSIGLTISDIFIKIFRCISLPIIALSMIVTLSSYNAEGALKKVWHRTVFYTLTTTMIAATISCLLYLLIDPTNINAASTPPITPMPAQTGYLHHVLSLIPTNIFSPFIEHQVMGVLVVGIVIGIAIRYIPDEASRESVTRFFKGIHGIFWVITKWVVAIIPIGLYGFITATVVELREGMDLSGIGKYLAVIVLANLVQGFIILPLWLKFNKIRPFVTMRKMMPALSVAFFSKSSTGTLPITIETAEKQLNMDPKISRFILPMCTSINMNGCSAFIFATVIYLMQNNGIEISLFSMATWIIISTIAAVGNAGVPMGCFFLSASLLSSMNVPITLLGLILPFYTLIDMLETSLNVWSDTSVAAVVDKKMAEMEETAKPLGEQLTT